MNDFDNFYRDEFGDVLRTVTLALGDAARAEEVTQEAFERALRRWRMVRQMAKPVGWVVVVAINAERKRWKREQVPSVALWPSEVAPEDEAGAIATAVAIRQSLERLTARQRAAVVLRYFADLPVADVATALGCAEGTAKATLHQALRIMRIDLEEDER